MDEAQQFAKAVELFQTGDLAGAERALEPLGGAGSGHPDVLHLSAVLLLEQDRPAEAADCFGRLIEVVEGASVPLEILRPMAVAYQRAGRIDEAARIAGDIVALASASLDDRLNLGFMLLESGQAEAALAAFERVLEQDHACGDAHFGCGRAALELGRFSVAGDAFAEASRLAPGDAEATFWHARALHGFGDRAGAIEKLRAALNTSPDFPEAYGDLGNLFAEAGDLEESMRA